MGYKSYKDLEIYKKGRILRNEVEDLTKTFPSKEQFRLTDQMIRSSRAVTALVVEGHGRYHFKEYIQKCRMSRGEALETDDHLTVALDRGYIDLSTYNDFEKKIQEIERMINGYIAYLQKRLRDDKGT